MLTQEYEINVVLIKKIMTEKKTTLLSLGEPDWKNQDRNRKDKNKLLPNIPTSNITELNELIGFTLQYFLNSRQGLRGAK